MRRSSAPPAQDVQRRGGDAFPLRPAAVTGAAAAITAAAAAAFGLLGAAPFAAQAQVVTVTPLPRSTPKPPAPRPRPHLHPATPPRPTFHKPTLLWKTFLRRVDGTPAIVDGVSYLGAGSYLYQIDSGGRTLWATETGSQHSTPALDTARVFIGSDRSVLFAMMRRTGQILWQFTGATGTILTRPAVAGGTVVAESTDNNVYGVDAGTGRQRWKFTRQDGSLGYASPVYDAAEKAVYTCGETTLYRLDPASGKAKWQAYVGGKSASTPETGGGRIYVGTDGTGLSAFSASSGAPLWNFKGERSDDWFGAPLYAEGTVYAATYNRYIYAIDAASGKAKWSYRVLGNSLAQPALDTSRGVLYVTSTTFRDNPTLTAIDARNGKPLWSYKAGYVDSAPVVSGDRLYVGSTSGYYYCFSLE